MERKLQKLAPNWMNNLYNPEVIARGVQGIMSAKNARTRSTIKQTEELRDHLLEYV